MTNLSLSLWVVERDDTLITNHLLPELSKRSSYEQVNRQGTAETQRNAILSYLRSHPQGLSNQEIEQQTGMRISSITGRMKELQEKGLVCGARTKTNELTGKVNVVWVAIDAQKD